MVLVVWTLACCSSLAFSEYICDFDVLTRSKFDYVFSACSILSLVQAPKLNSYTSIVHNQSEWDMYPIDVNDCVYMHIAQVERFESG